MIVIQLVILAGLIAFLKIYLPRMEKADATARLDARETRIEQFFNGMAVESSSAAGTANGETQTLRSRPSMQEVEQNLGAPDTSTTDFAGGLHLTWIGARHTLEGSFERGRLYALVLTDRRTGRSVMLTKARTLSSLLRRSAVASLGEQRQY